MADSDEKYYRADWMSDGQWACWQMVADIFGGFHHVGSKPKPFGRGICVNVRHGCWSTFDYTDLTRAVFLAHDRAIRFEIIPSGPGMLGISLHYRGQREGSMMERHPTLEQVVAEWRKGNG
jgi:hypothetical protein